MPVIHPSLFFVMECFPNNKDTLRQLYRTDKSFRVICQNYKKCAEALHYWAESDHVEAGERHREYLALLKELELEITKSLEDWSEKHLERQRKNND